VRVGLPRYQSLGNSEYHDVIIRESVPGCEGPGTRGKQPRSSAKVLQNSLSEKGHLRAVTALRWAWKQPSWGERVTAQGPRGAEIPKM